MEEFLFFVALIVFIYYSVTWPKDSDMGWTIYAIICAALLFGSVAGAHVETERRKEAWDKYCTETRDGYICRYPKYDDEGDTGGESCYGGRIAGC